MIRAPEDVGDACCIGRATLSGWYRPPIMKTPCFRASALAVPAAFLSLLLAGTSHAQAKAAGADEKPEPMSILSPAPVPHIEKFVRGTEPKWFEPGKVYVIEFWATWCGPCRQSMPHISDLADKYKDTVTFVGVSDEKVDTVTKFLDQDEWKKKARYNLATDPDRSTQQIGRAHV